MRFYDGNSSDSKLVTELTGHHFPENVYICGHEAHVVFSSMTGSYAGIDTGYHAKVHTVFGFNLPAPGQPGHCTSICQCGTNEGHCQSNDQCVIDHNCGFNNCKPELGYPNGTNCCYSITEYCSEFLTDNNGTWTLQAPANNPNEYVAEVTCKWFIDVAITQIESSTCGVDVVDFECCNSTNPCKAGEGNCIKDSDCEIGLICGQCEPRFPSYFDCCTNPEIVAHLAIQSFEVSFSNCECSSYFKYMYCLYFKMASGSMRFMKVIDNVKVPYDEINYAYVKKIPDNFTTTGSLLFIEWYSGYIPTLVNMVATITAMSVSVSGNTTLGDDSYCSGQKTCSHNEGDCDFNTHCLSNHICVPDSCPSNLGFANGTDCCQDMSCGYVSVKNGLLLSPYYPKLYESNLYCTHQISVDPGKIITIEFHSFKVNDLFSLRF